MGPPGDGPADTPASGPPATAGGADLPGTSPLHPDLAPAGTAPAGTAPNPTDAAPTPRLEPSHNRRIVSVTLPRFAMERWLAWAARQPDSPPDDLPIVLATEGPHGPVVHDLNRAAETAGVRRGARVVDMRALCPELRVEYADIAGDVAALERLMLWARRWCPWTATDGPAGLVMDTTGSDHLFGGEPALLTDIETRLSLLGFSARLAVAPTHGAAWALARFGPVRAVCPPERLDEATAPLPVRALRLDAPTVLTLERLGLKRIGALRDVPRMSLARRFREAELIANPLLRLDQLTGRLAEPVSSPEDPPRFAVQARLAEPVEDPVPHLPALFDELCTGLARAGHGARRLRLSVFRSDGEVSHVEAATAAPSRDPDHLRRLFDDRIDRIDPGFGFDLITLGATVAEEMAQTQTRLDGEAGGEMLVARLTDQLTARLGRRAVTRPAPRASHLPERRDRRVPALGGAIGGPIGGPRRQTDTGPAPEQANAPIPPRPTRLLEPAEEVRVIYAVPEGPPAQFVWRRQTHRVIRFAGPERIAPEWWSDHAGSRLRDYYRVETQHGVRIWLYREGRDGDGRGGPPLWFVQGLFS